MTNYNYTGCTAVIQANDTGCHSFKSFKIFGTYKLILVCINNIINAYSIKIILNYSSFIKNKEYYVTQLKRKRKWKFCH